MRYACGPDGKRIKAQLGEQGVCPSCRATVAAKCGDIVVHHWAHLAHTACHDTAEMSEWHHAMQDLYPIEWHEVVIRRGGKSRRADIQTRSGLVIEFQHSSLPAQEIEAREAFYEEMVWVWDVREPWNSNRLQITGGGEYREFSWEKPRKSIGACSWPILYLEPDKWFLCINHTDKMHHGTGRMIHPAFIEVPIIHTLTHTFGYDDLKVWTVPGDVPDVLRRVLP